MQESKRLHLTPFNPDLLPAVLPHKLHDQASNISFHSVQTCPENNYGFIELPVLQADQLRQKLHGCVLRGRKMKVEEAKPKKRSKGNDDTPVTNSKRTRSQKLKSKEDGTISAIELTGKRKVKRGWTEADDTEQNGADKSKKGTKKPKGKDASITGGAECLFKASIPPNASHNTAGDSAKKRKRRSDREVVVHEFGNTKKHAGFLKDDADSSDVQKAHEFLEGKGWVDQNGEVVEQVTKRRRSGGTYTKSDDIVPEPSKYNKRSQNVSANNEAQNVPEDEQTSSEGNSSSDSEATDVTTTGDVASGTVEGLGISSVDANSLQTAQVERLSLSRSTGSPEPASQKLPTSVPSAEVHPLESVFKRPKTAASHSQTPKKPHLEVSTSFNFFDTDATDSATGDATMLMPHTPFTQQDIRHRLIRSAAPTPDTALPGKTFGDVLARDSSEDMESELENGEQATAGIQHPERGSSESKGKAEEHPDSEFSKSFWEHRGDHNRRWKRQKREAVKEKKTQAKKEKRG